jgi:hypothetical protein
MRRLLRWLIRLGLALVAPILLLLSPAAWVELACRGNPVAQAHVPVLPEAARRAEERTYTTYPEWHIVHAYDDYAQVIATGDPHDFGYLRAIAGFWSSLCPLVEKADEHGGFTTESKQTIYTIGVSFTAELLAKAAYEETLGRIATWIRGAKRAPLDDLSARQAADYALFLRQTPWYRWNFSADAAALDAAATGSFRDRERNVALGLEFGAKSAYAGLIARAVAATGFDELTLRSIVSGLDAAELGAVDGITVIAERPEGIEIVTPRYRAFTRIALAIAAAGGDFVEIAGNDDILVTAVTAGQDDLGALFRFPRQGYGDYRHLMDVKVPDLARQLRALPQAGVRVEHIHDY